MKIVVFGATGGTGRELVEQALHQDRHVTARARTPEKSAGFEHPELEVVRGDVLDPQSVERAVVGQEAVVCAIGVGAERTTLREDGTRNVVSAMKKHDVSRSACDSARAVRESCESGSTDSDAKACSNRSLHAARSCGTY